MMKIAALFSIALFLQGCTYAISPEMTQRADKTIPFEKLQADPDSFKGKLLILGGTIVQITTVKQGTLIEVAQKQLDYWGQPERTKLTGGRFFAFHQGYLNTMAYAPGIDITLAGEVLGTGSPMISDTQYDYPVVLTKELKLWGHEVKTREKAPWMDPLYEPVRSGRPE
jgi:outer membrane lipoprotein